MSVCVFPVRCLLLPLLIVSVVRRCEARHVSCSLGMVFPVHLFVSVSVCLRLTLRPPRRVVAADQLTVLTSPCVASGHSDHASAAYQ